MSLPQGSLPLLPCLTADSKGYPVDSLSELTVWCPYCGEPIEVLVDQQEAGDEYIEDCQVCCKPILFSVAVDSWGNVAVTVRDENETC
ncbi:MAG: CPXCG motif-containing cysteine-rich protein [Haliea sp.]|jgi:hypothetical protein